MDEQVKIEQAENITKELQSLRNKKEEKFNSDNEPKETNKNALLRGEINCINNIDDQAELTVNLYKTSEEIKLYLDKPTKETEYSADNELIRTIRTYADIDKYNKDDVSKLIYRDIYVKKIDGEYELHIPKDISRKSQIKFKLRNFLINNNVISINTTKQKLNENNTVQFSMGSILIISSLIGLYVLNILSNPLYAISSLIMSFIIFMLSLAIILGIEEKIHDINENKCYTMYMLNYSIIVSLIIIYFSAFGYISHTNITIASISNTEILYSLIQLYSISATILSSLFYVKPTMKSIYNKFYNLFKSIKHKYKMKKGIEFR